MFYVPILSNQHICAKCFSYDLFAWFLSVRVRETLSPYYSICALLFFTDSSYCCHCSSPELTMVFKKKQLTMHWQRSTLTVITIQNDFCVRTSSMIVELWVAIVRREILILPVLLMKEDSVIRSLSRFVHHQTLANKPYTCTCAFNRCFYPCISVNFCRQQPCCPVLVTEEHDQ